MAKYRRVPYSYRTSKFTDATKVILHNSVNAFTVLGTAGDTELTSDIYVDMSRLLRGIPFASEVLDTVFALTDRHTVKKCEISSLALRFVSAVSLGEYLQHLRRIQLAAHKRSLYHCLLFCTLSLILECYGCGTLVAVDEKRQEAVFDSELPSLLGLYSLLELEPGMLQFLVSSIPDKVAASKCENSLSDFKWKRKGIIQLMRRNASAYHACLRAHEIAQSGIYERLDPELFEVHALAHTAVSLYSCNINYVFRDVMFCETERYGHVASMFQDDMGILMYRNIAMTRMWEHLADLGCIDKQVFYKRALYAKDAGIGFHLVNRKYSNECVSMFVREAHDPDNNSHLMLIDVEGLDGYIEFFKVIDMTDITNYVFDLPLDIAVDAFLKISAWCGVLGEAIPFKDNVFYAAFRTSLLSNVDAVSYPSEEEAISNIDESLDFFGQMMEWSAESMQDENLFYRKPIHWNYEPAVSGSSKPAVSGSTSEKMVTVGRYTRKLPLGFQPSSHARELAEKYFISLEDGKTFVDEFTRRTRGKSTKAPKVNKLNL